MVDGGGTMMPLRGVKSGSSSACGTSRSGKSARGKLAARRGDGIGNAPKSAKDDADTSRKRRPSGKKFALPVGVKRKACSFLCGFSIDDEDDTRPGHATKWRRPHRKGGDCMHCWRVWHGEFSYQEEHGDKLQFQKDLGADKDLLDAFHTRVGIYVKKKQAGLFSVSPRMRELRNQR